MYFVFGSHLLFVKVFLICWNVCYFIINLSFHLCSSVYHFLIILSFPLCSCINWNYFNLSTILSNQHFKHFPKCNNLKGKRQRNIKKLSIKFVSCNVTYSILFLCSVSHLSLRNLFRFPSCLFSALISAPILFVL